MIVRPRTWRAVVGTAGQKGCLMKLVHELPRVHREAQVDRAFRRLVLRGPEAGPVLSDPELRALATIPGDPVRSRVLARNQRHHALDADGTKAQVKESKAAVEVDNGQAKVVKHAAIFAQT